MLKLKNNFKNILIVTLILLTGGVGGFFAFNYFGETVVTGTYEGQIDMGRSKTLNLKYFAGLKKLEWDGTVTVSDGCGIVDKVEVKPSNLSDKPYDFEIYRGSFGGENMLCTMSLVDRDFTGEAWGIYLNQGQASDLSNQFNIELLYSRD